LGLGVNCSRVPGVCVVVTVLVYVRTWLGAGLGLGEG
jgi:hypothetical protein